jgi:hypothetical protein
MTVNEIEGWGCANKVKYFKIASLYFCLIISWMFYWGSVDPHTEVK